MCPGVALLAGDADDPVALADTGFGGDALAAPDQRQELGLADQKHQPQQPQAQNQIEHRAGSHDGDPRTQRLPIERALGLGDRNTGFALVEHLHIATEGNGSDLVDRSVPGLALPQRLAKADRKALDLDPEAARHPEVPELVEGNQDAKADDQPPDRSEEGFHG